MLWFNFYLSLFFTHYHALPYPKTKENRNWTKNEIEPQHLYLAGTVKYNVTVLVASDTLLCLHNKGRVVQHTRTARDRETMVSVRTIRTDRERQIRSVKKSSRSVNCISFVGLKIFHSCCEREMSLFLTDRTVRTDRERQIRSVKKSSRSVNCISLVGLRIFHCRCEREISLLRTVQFVRTVNFRYSPYIRVHGP